MPTKVAIVQSKHRNTMESFHMTPEEDKLLDLLVKSSGLSKQEYMYNCCLHHSITVMGTPRLYKVIQTQIEELIRELSRITKASEISEDVMNLLKITAPMAVALKEDESTFEVDLRP